MEEKEKKGLKIIKEVIPYVIVIVLVLLFKKFVFAPIKVNGESMMNTLKDGDIMILNIIDYKMHGLKRFDIVVVDEGEELIIKRVIGLPGEEVEYRDNQLYINGKKVKDKYASQETEDFSEVVPKGEYFVLGDNRTNSLDSRVFGTFSSKKIKGKTSMIVFPFSRWGNKE